ARSDQQWNPERVPHLPRWYAAGKAGRLPTRWSAERLAVPPPHRPDGVGEVDVDAVERDVERARDTRADLLRQGGRVVGAHLADVLHRHEGGGRAIAAERHRQPGHQ